MKNLIPVVLILLLHHSWVFGQNTNVQHVGSMTEMGKENFAPHIRLDTLKNKAYFFGMGPLGRMQGEITVLNGKPLGVSVNGKGEGVVGVSWNIEAPFFVYANVAEWTAYPLETAFKSTAELQRVVEEIAQKQGFNLTVPFAFRIAGKFDAVTTHIVMPRSEDIPGYQPGKKQADYPLTHQTGELLGFYSQSHQGIYTAKNSFVHVHFVSEDMATMGHVDHLSVQKPTLTLYLPKKAKVGSRQLNVNDTDFSKGRLGHLQKIDLQDIEKFHGHLCDGLVEGFLALEQGLQTLYPDGIIDRTNTRIVSKPSPCLTDAAIYMTGGRYQFNSFYVSEAIEGMYVIQRIDTGKSISVRRKPNIKPAVIDLMGSKAVKGELTACELDVLKEYEDDYSVFLQQSEAKDLFEVKEISNFRWQPEMRSDFIKTDILNKEALKCR